MSETVHVGCSVLCHALPNFTSDVVLDMDWLYAINPLIDWNNKSLCLKCGVDILRILGIEYDCFHAYVEVCALTLVLKKMHSDKVLAWLGVLRL